MISYEKAIVSDFLSIAKLDREAWQSNKNSEYIPDGEHVWRLWVEHALVFIAKDNTETIGAILAFPCISSKWCVHKVFVNNAQRGLGIGTKLFEVLLREIDIIKVESFLTVDPTNDTAIKLYEKWGFTERTFIKGFYRRNEDRFVLARHISQE